MYRDWGVIGNFFAMRVRWRCWNIGQRMPSALVYVGRNGIVDRLSEAAAGLDETPSQRAFPSSDAKRILATQQDDLGNEVLARGQMLPTPIWLFCFRHSMAIHLLARCNRGKK